MKSELAQRNVVLDFEIIAFLTLIFGLIGYSLIRRFQRQDLPGPDYYGKIDLVLMFVPAFLFLTMPFLQVAFPEATGLEQKENETLNRIEDILGSVVNVGFFIFVVFLTYAIMRWMRNIDIVEAFGLKKMSFRMIVIISILGGAATVFICGVFLGEMAQNYLSGIFTDLREQAPVQDFKKSTSQITLVIKVIGACIAAPLAEEVLFRGYMHGALRRFTSPIFAAVVVSALFASAHGNLPALMPLWILAILLTVSYEVTKTIWVPIGIHAVFNAVNVVFILAGEEPETAAMLFWF